MEAHEKVSRNLEWWQIQYRVQPVIELFDDSELIHFNTNATVVLSNI